MYEKEEIPIVKIFPVIKEEPIIEDEDIFNSIGEGGIESEFTEKDSLPYFEEKGRICRMLKNDCEKPEMYFKNVVIVNSIDTSTADTKMSQLEEINGTIIKDVNLEAMVDS